MPAAPVRVSELLERWHPLSLCRCYFSTHFAQKRVQVLIDDALTELAVTCAVGVLADGSWEVLGAWPGVAVGSAVWRGVCDDLGSRGVDRISLVCASDLAAWTLCPSVKELLPFRFILGHGSLPAASRVGFLRAEARRLIREASGIRAARFSLEQLHSRPGEGRAGVLSPDWLTVLEQFRRVYALRPNRRALACEGAWSSWAACWPALCAAMARLPTCALRCPLWPGPWLGARPGSTGPSCRLCLIRRIRSAALWLALRPEPLFDLSWTPWCRLYLFDPAWRDLPCSRTYPRSFSAYAPR